MKTKLLFFIVLLCFGLSALVAQREEVHASYKRIIIIGDDALFLNQIAVTDSRDCYQDTKNHLILRSGEPGSYHYEVVALQADAPMPLISWEDAFHYCDWLQSKDGKSEEFYIPQATSETGEQSDQKLKSTQLRFQFFKASIQAHQAGIDEAVEVTEVHQILEEIVTAIVLGGAVRSEVSGSSETNPISSVERRQEADDVAAALVPLPVEGKREQEIQHKGIQEEERSKLVTAIHAMVLQHSEAPNFHYHGVEKLWTALQQAREDRIQAELERPLRQQEVAKAKIVLEEATAANTSEALQKTILGHISKYSEQSIPCLGYLPLPFVGGAADVLSKATGLLNKAWSIGNLLLAQRAFDQATQRH